MPGRKPQMSRNYTPSWRREVNEWLCNPHTSAMSDVMKAHAAKNRHIPKVRESRMCQACGAVSIIGGNRLRESNESVYGAYYCDKKCAESDRGRVYRTSLEYQAKCDARCEREGKRRNWEKEVCALVWQECVHCGKPFAKRNGRSCCSEKCRVAVENTHYEVTKERQRLQYEKQSGVVVCAMCGKDSKVEQRLGLRRFCSVKCAARSIRLNRRHRKRTNGLYETISIQHLIKKHKGKCVECGCRVVSQSGEYQDNAATIDHVVPLSKGGPHTWNNVQLMCHKCNRVKSNTVKPGTQMLLPMRD